MVKDVVAPSNVGSAYHDKFMCRPCRFFQLGQCMNGESCEFCHFEHDQMWTDAKTASLYSQTMLIRQEFFSTNGSVDNLVVSTDHLSPNASGTSANSQENFMNTQEFITICKEDKNNIHHPLSLKINTQFE